MSGKASPATPRTYVVRVYRVMRAAVAGQIEDVDSRFTRSFTSAEELWAAIRGRRGRAKPPPTEDR